MATLIELTLQEYLCKITFLMKNPRVEQQPDYPCIIRDTFYYMFIDLSEKEGDKNQYSRLYFLAEQLTSENLQIACFMLGDFLEQIYTLPTFPSVF